MSILGRNCVYPPITIFLYLLFFFLAVLHNFVQLCSHKPPPGGVYIYSLGSYVKHSSSTVFFHWSLSWAWCSIWVHRRPICRSSCSADLLQLFFFFVSTRSEIDMRSLVSISIWSFFPFRSRLLLLTRSTVLC